MRPKGSPGEKRKGTVSYADAACLKTHHGCLRLKKGQRRLTRQFRGREISTSNNLYGCKLMRLSKDGDSGLSLRFILLAGTRIGPNSRRYRAAQGEQVALKEV